MKIAVKNFHRKLIVTTITTILTTSTFVIIFLLLLTQPKLRRVCKQGLFSAAKTTGAWVTTAGTNTGEIIRLLYGNFFSHHLSLFHHQSYLTTLSLPFKAPLPHFHNTSPIVKPPSSSPHSHHATFTPPLPHPSRSDEACGGCPRRHFGTI